MLLGCCEGHALAGLGLFRHLIAVTLHIPSVWRCLLELFVWDRVQEGCVLSHKRIVGFTGVLL